MLGSWLASLCIPLLLFLPAEHPQPCRQHHWRASAAAPTHRQLHVRAGAESGRRQDGWEGSSACWCQLCHTEVLTPC